MHKCHGMCQVSNTGNVTHLAAPVGMAFQSSLSRMLCNDTMLLEWNACVRGAHEFNHKRGSSIHCLARLLGWRCMRKL